MNPIGQIKLRNLGKPLWKAMKSSRSQVKFSAV